MIKSNAHTTAAIHFQLDVVDGKGRVVRRLPKKRNLILNQGLDFIGSAAADWQTCTNSVAVGTGALVTKRASGAVTISAAAGTLTASAGFFVAGDVGRVLKLNSGEEFIITGFTSATVVTSTNTASVAAVAGTIHYTTLTGLVTETERSSTVAPGGARTSVYDATLKTWTHTVILLTPVLATSRTYTEIGWSHNGTAGANLFGCAVISPSQTLGAGQRLRVTLAVVVKPSPMSIVSVNTGLAVGNALTELTGSAAGSVSFNWASLGTGSPALAGPSTSSEPSIGTTQVAGTNTLAAYTNGTYARTANFEFADSLGAITANSLRLYLGANVGGVLSSWRILFSAPLVKTGTDRVNGSFVFSWGRELVN